MSAIKHTPGPWSVGPKGGCVVSVAPIQDIPEGTGHADIEYYGGYLICESIWRNEDARLIAATPELLNAVRQQHDIIDTLLAMLITADPTFRPTKSEIWPRIEAVGAVQLIAKATGAA